MTTINREKLLEKILGYLSPEEKGNSIIYWYKKILDKGAEISAGNERLNMPFKGYMAFADLEPKVNWGHSALFFLVDSETLNVEVIQSRFPPFLDDYPPEYVVILRYGVSPPNERYFEVYD